MRKRLFLSLFVAAIAIPLGIALLWYFNYDFRNYALLKSRYPDYLKWKESGGSINEAFYKPLNADRSRDKLVDGLSYEQIKAKLPFLTEGINYSSDSYKGQFLKGLKEGKPNIKLLWFKNEDGFDWCVEVEGNRATISLIKG